MPAYALEFQERQRAMKEGRRLLEIGEDVEERPSPSRIVEPPVDDWKARRLADEQKKLDEGEGYGSMIVDQIWDVWNWGEKKAEELKEKDEQVVGEQKGRRNGVGRLLDRQRPSLQERRTRWAEEFPEIGKG